MLRSSRLLGAPPALVLLSPHSHLHPIPVLIHIPISIPVLSPIPLPVAIIFIPITIPSLQEQAVPSTSRLGMVTQKEACGCSLSKAARKRKLILTHFFWRGLKGPLRKEITWSHICQQKACFYIYIFFSCGELVTVVQRLIFPICLIETEPEINPGRSLVLPLAVLALLDATSAAPLLEAVADCFLLAWSHRIIWAAETNVLHLHTVSL